MQWKNHSNKSASKSIENRLYRGVFPRIPNSNSKYKQNDLLEIAKGQLQKEKTNINPIAIHDTDLITIKIWSKYKYNQCNPWIIKQIELQKSENRLYLVCKPDIPWEADPLRENPSNRAELFEIYLSEIQNTKHPYYIINLFITLHCLDGVPLQAEIIPIEPAQVMLRREGN